MAQECGFFNAQLAGEEYDRVYLAETFAAYFASFIGNGVFGKSMQQLEVVAYPSAVMKVDVLSGQGWINGYWYRNTDNYTLDLSVADGVLSRVDLVVLRWSNSERNMYLTVIEGTPSANPAVPQIRRDADFYDLELAQINVGAGVVGITQSNITDMRMNTNVCGFVTGLIEQVDTTDLWNQFQDYFSKFKSTNEKDYNDWTAYQKQAYLDYIAAAEAAYDQFIATSETNYNTWVQNQENAMAQYIAVTKQAYANFVSQMEGDYTDWTDAEKAKYEKWYIDHTTQWTTEFYYWFDNIKQQLSGDVAGQLQDAIDKVNEKVDGYIDRTTTFSADGKTITQVSTEQTIVTTFVDPTHITQDYYVNNVKVKTESITFSTDGRVITEAKEVI